MKHFTVLSLIIMILTGCGKSPTIEETILINAFTSLQAAYVYDEVCNKVDPKSHYDFKIEKNLNLFDNERMLVAKLGGIWHIRNPKKSVKEGVEVMRDMQLKIQERARKVYAEQGCDSEPAKSAARSLSTFSKNGSFVLISAIDKEIENKGGHVTTVEEVEAVGK